MDDQPELGLFIPPTPPLDNVWVALDIETTGLSPETDDVIEVGAVKFRGEETIDTFHSFVNPYRVLGRFTKQHTGIKQKDVDSAPPFSHIAPDLLAFLGNEALIGHNLAFDLDFLANNGLMLLNPKCDTWDLAFVLLPEGQEYALGKLAASLGINHPRPHRALEDAKVTNKVFIKLLGIASKLDVFVLAEMERLASRSGWVLATLLRSLGNQQMKERSGGPESIEKRTTVTGLDHQALRGRLRASKPLRANRKEKKIDLDNVDVFFREAGAMSAAFEEYQERPQQIAMARAVAEAINGGTNLIVEAGTGVGKSLAYLLPAVMYAISNNRRVVISTNTINLQEQLLNKDIPALDRAMTLAPNGSTGELCATQLKGRANYVCLKRWSLLRSSEALSEDEARLLSKILVWVGTTGTGDRSELNLGYRAAAAPWDRISAQGAADCTGVDGICFLRGAREKAAASHVVVVNHALLIADLITGGTLIPEHDVLVIDEAQHLEEVATKHFGFELSQLRINEHLELLSGNSLFSKVEVLARGSAIAETRQRTIKEATTKISVLLPDVRQTVAALFGSLAGLLKDGMEAPEHRITSADRGEHTWLQLEGQWENADLAIAEVQRGLRELEIALEGLEEVNLPGYEALLMEVFNATQVNSELRDNLEEFVSRPKEDGVYWVSRAQWTRDLVIHKAPLEVGGTLEKMLFGQRDTVVMTSATLSADGTFEHIRKSTGIGVSAELLLDSPFDYPRVALLCLPQDIPEPASERYQEVLAGAIVDAAKAAGGHTMCLFTSNASLKAAAMAVRGDLQSAGIEVLAQGIDGSAHQLTRRFLDNPSSIILGTSSFWEGVDLPGDSLKVLMVARLPFNVPTDPVFEARTELFEEPFTEYALPQAILKFRQGFGRLIRTKTDRGVVVVLDKRIISRRYGKAILDSLPPLTSKRCVLRDLPAEICSWLQTN